MILKYDNSCIKEIDFIECSALFNVELLHKRRCSLRRMRIVPASPSWI